MCGLTYALFGLIFYIRGLAFSFSLVILWRFLREDTLLKNVLVCKCMYMHVDLCNIVHNRCVLCILYHMQKVQQCCSCVSSLNMQYMPTIIDFGSKKLPISYMHKEIIFKLKWRKWNWNACVCVSMTRINADVHSSEKQPFPPMQTPLQHFYHECKSIILVNGRVLVLCTTLLFDYFLPSLHFNIFLFLQKNVSKIFTLTSISSKIRYFALTADISKIRCN